ncbi:MAG: saccharopine dehydrogenase NADP-binding domain-containing protein [Actinobacteria bacterium]|nr:saccharopine dehydrogenase NADP-binding domain-containing protein [Actinomycetota bacterium]
MRVLMLGAGGVGESAALIAARRDFFESWIVADYDLDRAQAVVDRIADPRFRAAQVDANDPAALAALATADGATHLLNVVDPRFVMNAFEAARIADCAYLDTAMSLSAKHAERPYELTGVKLGDLQFAEAEEWERSDRLALVGIGVEPGMVDVFARYAYDNLFDEIDELGVRDASDMVVAGYDFAPSFSIWTVIEECLNPPIVWEKDKGWYTTEPFSGAEVFDFPEGIGPVEVVNVEHEEVVLMPRWIPAKKVTFKFGLGDEFIEVLKTLHKLGLDRTEPVTVRGQQVSPRDVVAACLPDPAKLGDRISGKTCAGLYVTGRGKDGKPRAVYMYHVADNTWTMGEYGTQAVVWQTGMNPVVALELLATGVWSGCGVLGPEAFPAEPFMELLRDGYGQEWVIEEREPV